MDYDLIAEKMVEELPHDSNWLRSLVAKHMQPGETLAEFIARTDEELRKQIKAELTGVLLGMWTALGREVDKVQLTHYVQEFDGYPPERLRVAIASIMRTRKWNSIPTIGEIYAEMKKTAFDLPSVGAEDR